MKKESTVMQLDVKDEQLALKNKIVRSSELGQAPKKSEREIALSRYAKFFERNLSVIDDITNPNYSALEVVNDEGLIVSRELQQNGNFSNFKICHANLLEVLLENPAKLSEINLVHAVMPFEDVYPLVQALVKIPEVTKAKTRVVFGCYDNAEDSEHDFNIRVLNGLIRDLDFCRFKSANYDGTSVKMVVSTYQKNLRMRH